jgi:hypothetical protein
LDNYLLNFSNPHIDIAKGTVSGRDVLNYSSNNGDFSVLCNNCNITIQNYDILARFISRNGWLNYTVNGTGTQSFNLHYTSTIYQPLNWTVHFNDAVVPSNIWSLSSDDWLTISSSNSKVSIYYQMIDSPKDGLTSLPLYIIVFSVISAIILFIVLVLIVVLFKKKANH